MTPDIDRRRATFDGAIANIYETKSKASKFMTVSCEETRQSDLM